MKKLMLVAMTVVTFTGAQMQTASAGDREWATAGKVLTGVVIGSALTRAFEPQPTYYTSGAYYSYAPTYYSYTPGYCAPPVYVQPAPVVVAPPPVYVTPAPRAYFHFGYNFGSHHRYRHCW